MSDNKLLEEMRAACLQVNAPIGNMTSIGEVLDQVNLAKRQFNQYCTPENIIALIDALIALRQQPAEPRQPVAQVRGQWSLPNSFGKKHRELFIDFTQPKIQLREGALLYTTPPTPPDARMALEMAAKICEAQEKIMAEYPDSAPQAEQCRYLKNAIRALIVPPATTPSKEVDERAEFEKLLPCPFCGKPPVWRRWPRRELDILEHKCAHADFNTCCFHNDKAAKSEKVAMWNIRFQAGAALNAMSDTDALTWEHRKRSDMEPRTDYPSKQNDIVKVDVVDMDNFLQKHKWLTEIDPCPFCKGTGFRGRGVECDACKTREPMSAFAFSMLVISFLNTAAVDGELDTKAVDALSKIVRCYAKLTYQWESMKEAPKAKGEPS